MVCLVWSLPLNLAFFYLFDRPYLNRTDLEWVVYATYWLLVSFRRLSLPGSSTLVIASLYMFHRFHEGRTALQGAVHPTYWLPFKLESIPLLGFQSLVPAFCRLLCAFIQAEQILRVYITGNQSSLDDCLCLGLDPDARFLST